MFQIELMWCQRTRRAIHDMSWQKMDTFNGGLPCQEKPKERGSVEINLGLALTESERENSAADKRHRRHASLR